MLFWVNSVSFIDNCLNFLLFLFFIFLTKYLKQVVIITSKLLCKGMSKANAGDNLKVKS